MREGGGNGCLLCGMKMLTMSLTSWLPMCHVILLTHWVVHGSGALGVAAVVIHGAAQSSTGIGGIVPVFVCVGSRSHLLGSCLLCTGCCFLVVVFFACSYQSGRPLSGHRGCLWWCGLCNVACGQHEGCMHCCQHW